MDLLHKIKKIITEEHLIKKDEKVLVGVSGGIDSVTLFHLLLSLSHEMQFTVGIAHINHMLRGEESRRDEAFVLNLARERQVPVYVKRFDVMAYAKEKGLSIQHAARDLRYSFFYEIAEKHNYNKIAIGHNLDDQVETFLLRLIKGTGIKGLVSIPIMRDMIIRPLLYTYRYEIEDYAKRHSISYVEDSSNKKTYYERNFIRKEIIPLIERLNPSFKEKVFFLLKDITDVNKTLENIADDFLKERIYTDREDIWCKIDDLLGLDNEIRFRVLSGILGMIKPDFILLREHARLIDKILHSRRPNLSITLPHNIRVKRSYDKIVFTKKHQEKRIEGVFEIHEGINLLEPFGIIIEAEKYSKRELLPFINPFEGRFGENTAFFDSEKLGKLYIRSFREGDRFFPLGMDKKVKVKDFFISRKVPLEERRRIPILLSDDEIAWIIGHRIDNRFKVTEDTETILKVEAMPIHRETSAQS